MSDTICNSFESLKPMIVSYWRDMVEILTINRSNNFHVFIGTFQMGSDTPIRRVGVCYDSYPSAHGRIAPLMLPYEASLIFLNGLLMDAIQKNDTKVANSILDAIDHIKNEN